jgi:hypothetical protein
VSPSYDAALDASWDEYQVDVGDQDMLDAQLCELDVAEAEAERRGSVLESQTEALS